MKIVKITCIAIFGSLLMACNQKNENAAVTDNTNEITTADNQIEADTNATPINPEEAPVLQLEQEVYDFGDVEAGSKTEKVIEFTNAGKTPLLIQSASASCGCTVPEYSKEPVAPGEKGQLTVSYSAPQINGAQSKTVTLNTNTAKAVETFRIKANVVGGKDRQAPQPQSTNLPAPNLGNVN